MTEQTDGAHAVGAPRGDGGGDAGSGSTHPDLGEDDKGEYTDQESATGAGTVDTGDAVPGQGEDYVDKDISAPPDPEDTGEYEDKDVADDRPPPAEGGYTDTRD